MAMDKVSSAAGVVRFVREKGGATVQDLDEVWGPRGSAYYGQVCEGQLRRLLDGLKDAGLISWEGDFSRPTFVKVTPLLEQVREALDFHLNEIEKLHRKKAMILFPLLGRPDTTPVDVFVAMPFDEAFTPVWKTIKRCIGKQERSFTRADQFSAPRSIMEDIWNGINAAKVVVADCTGRNANVFYEIGLAHAIGREVVPLTQNTSDIPFDLSQFRHIKYDLTPGGLKKLAEELTNWLEPILGPSTSALTSTKLRRKRRS